MQDTKSNDKSSDTNEPPKSPKMAKIVKGTFEQTRKKLPQMLKQKRADEAKRKKVDL